MKARPLLPATLLLDAIKARTHRVTMTLINPLDMPKVDLMFLRLALGGTEILPSEDVERGMLYINTKQLR